MFFSCGSKLSGFSGKTYRATASWEWEGNLSRGSDALPPLWTTAPPLGRAQWYCCMVVQGWCSPVLLFKQSRETCKVQETKCGVAEGKQPPKISTCPLNAFLPYLPRQAQWDTSPDFSDFKSELPIPICGPQQRTSPIPDLTDTPLGSHPPQLDSYLILILISSDSLQLWYRHCCAFYP